MIECPGCKYPDLNAKCNYCFICGTKVLIEKSDEPFVCDYCGNPVRIRRKGELV